MGERNDSEARYCIRCGSSLQATEIDGFLRPLCPECGWVHYAHLKVGAAALIQKSDRVLLVRRAQEPFRGMWSLPSGYVEGSEDPRIAASREAFEETGLEVATGAVFDTFFYDDDPRGNGVLIVYDAVVMEGAARLSDENDALQWFVKDDLPSSIAGGGHDQAIATWSNDDGPYLTAAEIDLIDENSLRAQVVLSIIRDESDRILLQLRDDREDVHFPGIWALFAASR